VKFAIDAQLPRRMTGWITAAGGDAVHTLDLPEANRTKDNDFRNVADSEDRILVTKDSDFVDSHILKGSPKKLLLISTGNISNLGLESLFVAALPDIIREFASNSFLELCRTGLSIRG